MSKWATDTFALARTNTTAQQPGRARSISDALGKIGAGEGARTLDPDLGKVVLYH